MDVSKFSGISDQFVQEYDSLYNTENMPVEAIRAFNKALVANEVKNIETDTTGFGATQLHSMDSVMKNLTYRDTDLTFWRLIKKSTAQQLIEQWASVLGYGGGDGFTTQGGLPIDADIVYDHGFEEVKIIRHVWRVNDIVGFVSSITNGVRDQKRAAAQRVLRDANRKLYSGDKSINPLEFDGIYAAVKSRGGTANIYNSRGAVFSKDVMNELTQVIRENWGRPDGARVLCSPAGKSLLSSVYTGDPTVTIQRNQIFSGPNGEIMPGHIFDKFSTMYGTLYIEVDNFIAAEYERREVPKIRDTTDPKKFVEGAESKAAPDQVLVANITLTDVAAPVGYTSDFVAGHPSRPSGIAYDYRVCARSNDGGRGKASTVKTLGAVMTAGNVVKIDIAAPASGVKPDSYEIFSRTTPGGSPGAEFYSIGRVKANADGSATFYDDNQTIPGTTCIFIVTEGDGEEATMAFKQLTPMYNKSMSAIGMYDWGVVNLYGMPIWYAPQKFGIIKNVPVNTSSEGAKYIL